MTYTELCDTLRDSGIENAEFEAFLLINFFCKRSRAEIFAEPEYQYNKKELFDAVDKRCERYPLQYIFGEWDFFGETYTVNENCLIPRPDTEMLVEYAIKNLPAGARFADLCTGSGCIAISTLVHRPDTSAIAVDVFEKPLELAKVNAERNNVSDRFTAVLCNLLTDELTQDGFDAVISNPPYIRTAVVDTLEEELFSEPRAALDGGEDGLIFYRKILSVHSKALKSGGFILFEIGYDHCEVRKDLSGNPRMAILKR